MYSLSFDLHLINVWIGQFFLITLIGKDYCWVKLSLWTDMSSNGSIFNFMLPITNIHSCTKSAVKPNKLQWLFYKYAAKFNILNSINNLLTIPYKFIRQWATNNAARLATREKTLMKKSIELITTLRFFLPFLNP